MALPITIPYTFANATTSIPLANLDSDFTTVVNGINGIANGVNALSNVLVTGGNIYSANISNATITSSVIVSAGPNAASTNLFNAGYANNRGDISLGNSVYTAYLVKESSTATNIPSVIHISRQSNSSPTLMVAFNLSGAMGFDSTAGAYNPSYGASGQVLTSQGTAGPPYWGAGGGGGGGNGSGTVTSITAGTNLTGGVISTSGTIALASTVSSITLTSSTISNAASVGIGPDAGTSNLLNIAYANNKGDLCLGDNTYAAYLIKESSTASTNQNMIHISRGPLSGPAMMLAINLSGALGFNNSGAYIPNYGTSGQVLISQGTSSPPYWGPGGGTVTSLATGTGLTGGPVTTTGTISIASTGVSAATYGSASNVSVIAVNAQGQITSASNTAIAISGAAITSGAVGVAYGGTGLTSSGTSGNVLISNGSVWTSSPLTNVGYNGTNTATATLTIDATYNQKTLEMNSTGGLVVQLPSNVTTPVKIDVVQLGNGTVQFSALSGASVNSRVGTTIYMSAQWSGATIYNNSAGNLAAWVVVGDVAPST